MTPSHTKSGPGRVHSTAKSIRGTLAGANFGNKPARKAALVLLTTKRSPGSFPKHMQKKSCLVAFTDVQQ